MRKVLTSILLLMVLSACATAPAAAPEPVTPVPSSTEVLQQECDYASIEADKALTSAKEEEKLYDSLIVMRESVINSIKAKFDIEETMLQSAMPPAPIVIFPPDVPMEDCSSMSIGLNHELAEVALTAGKKYRDASNIERHVYDVLLEVSGWTSFDYDSYTELVASAIKVAEAENAK